MPRKQGLLIAAFLGFIIPVTIFAQSGNAAESSPRGKITFDLKQSNHQLVWNGETFDRDDPRILNELSDSPEGKTLIESYESRRKTSSVLGWTALAGSAGGLFLALSTTPGRGNESLNSLSWGVILAGAGVATWILSSLEGNAADGDLAKAVNLYNGVH